MGLIRRALLGEEGKVASVCIGGDSGYNTSRIFRKRSTVRIQYHSAKEPLLARLLSV